jgi:biopolymer transport protein ExbD
MTSLMLMLTLAIGITVARAWAAEEKEAKEEKDATISLNKLPAAVKATILAQSNGAEIKGIEKEDEDGKTVYSADLIKGKATVEITVSEDGKFLDSETKIALSDAPDAVKATLTQEAKGSKLGKEIDKVTAADGAVTYEADVKIDGKKFEIQIDPDGKVLKREAEAKEKDEKGEKGEKDKKLTLDKVPAAVKAAILAQSNGAEIKGIEKEKEDGKIVYSADLIKDKAKSEITVSEDGKFLASATKIALSDAPDAVKATVEQKVEIEKVVLADGTVAYEAIVKIDGKKSEIRIDSAGKILKQEADNEEKNKKDEKD